MNLDVLLAPLSGDHPCGEDLSFSADFDQIAEMRREDDPTLSQGEWITPLKVADWPGVADRCQHLLSTRSKDLRLAQWLTEAWCQTDGFIGMANGVRVCQALCANHWHDLHPQADAGDMEQRIGNLTWLLHRLVQLIPTRPWVHSRQGRHYSLQDLQIAQQLVLQPTDAPHTSAQGPALTTEQFMKALKETPKPQLAATARALDDIKAHLRTWQDQIDTQLGDDGPSFVPVKEVLDRAHHDIHRLIKEVGGLPADATVTTATNSPAAAIPDAGSLSDVRQALHGPICSRAEALQQLGEVAAFFRRTEPHSPVAYLAEKAVRWGDMPLHEWLRQVIKDQGALSQLDELLGIAAAPSDTVTDY